jgi:copper oxidase (laccase) domain-containing protein
MVRAQLVESGLVEEDIDDVFGCTFGDEARYFSFRRDGNPSGRMLSAIVGGR